MSDRILNDGEEARFLSATDLMVRVMEHFGKSEADKICIIWTNANGDIRAISNTSLSHSVGMMTIGIDIARDDSKRAYEEDEEEY